MAEAPDLEEEQLVKLGVGSSKYTREVLEEAVLASRTFAGVLRHLGLPQAGGTQSHIARQVRKMGIDTSHFTGQAWSRGISLPNQRRTADSILVRMPEGSLRAKRLHLHRAMLENGIAEVCVVCGLGKVWNGSDLVLEIDHEDGDFLNNELANLRFLCPNCHSQQGTKRSWRK